MDDIIITCDSTSDLSPELKERYNVNILPLGIALGDKQYTDGVDINPDMIYEHHDKTGELPKTNAVNVEQAYNFFKPFVDAGKTVIHFSLSSDMSSSYNNTRIAAQEFENVYVIDTKNLSTGSAILLLRTAEMRDKGMSAKEIVAELERIVPCVDASFVIDNLEYLYKGGRCSALAMLGANLLKIKPMIQVKNGVMGVGKKYRGNYAKVLKEYVADHLGDCSDVCLDRIFVTHAGVDPDIVNDIVEQVKATANFKEVFMTRAGCTISSHCGANTLGILFIRKSPLK